MSVEIFLQDKQYKKMKKAYEQEYFKLNGKYCWYDNDKLTYMCKSDIEEYFKNKKVSIEYVEEQTTKKGTTISTTKSLTKSFYQIWSEDPEMKEYKEVIFDCDIEKIKPYKFNLFTGFSHFENQKSEKVDLSLIFEHIKSLANYNDADYNYIISWLAQLVQQPHILPHTCLIFISEEGVGKDIFAKFLSNVLSDKYTHNTEKLEQICGKFNSIMGGKLLMVVNETNPVESRERIENIKFLITAEDLTIEGKHKDPIKCKNFARFVFFSNRLFAFPVEENARRPKLMKASSKYLSQNIGEEAHDKFFKELIGQYKSPKYQQAFLNYLKNYDISKFNPRNFEKSELHQELEDSSISPIVGFLAYIVKQNKNDKIVKYSATEIMAIIKAHMTEKGYKYDISPAKLSVELTMNYNIKKVKNSSIFYELDIGKLRTLLETKYKYNFDDDEDDEPLSLYPELDGKTKREIELEKENKAMKKKNEEFALEIEKLKKEIENLKKPKEEINGYKEVFLKHSSDVDDLEAELIALTSTEQKQNILIIDDVESLDDLRNIEAQLKKQKKNKKV